MNNLTLKHSIACVAALLSVFVIGCRTISCSPASINNKLSVIKTFLSHEAVACGVEGALSIEGISFKLLRTGEGVRGYMEFYPDHSYQVSYFGTEPMLPKDHGGALRGAAGEVRRFIEEVLAADAVIYEALEVEGVYWRVHGNNDFSGFLSLGPDGGNKRESRIQQEKTLRCQSDEIFEKIRFLKRIISDKMQAQGCTDRFQLQNIAFNTSYSGFVWIGNLQFVNGVPVKIKLSSQCNKGALSKSNSIGAYKEVVQLLVAVLTEGNISFDDVEFDMVSWVFDDEVGLGEMSLDSNGNITRFNFYDKDGNVFMERDGKVLP